MKTYEQSTPIQEDPEQSCKVIIQYLQKISNPNKRDLLYQDLASKINSVRPETQNSCFRQLFFLPDSPRVKEYFVNMKDEVFSPKPQIDIAIVTITPEELTAAKIVFGIPKDKNENKYIDGCRYWEFEIITSEHQIIKSVLTMIGMQRNKECMNACHRLFSIYDISLCILVGIAAGIKTSLTLGDVVSAKEIIDYEGERLEPEKNKIRPEPFTPTQQIRRDLSYFNPENYNWKSKLIKILRNNNLFLDVSRFDTYNPKYKSCVILSGEKLFADGVTLLELRDKYHEKALAGETEGSGFACACNDASIPWLVFRAISDYGDPNKPESDDYQIAYSVGAALAAFLYIENDFRKNNIPDL